jgi:hypothetical protein
MEPGVDRRTQTGLAPSQNHRTHRSSKAPRPSVTAVLPFRGTSDSQRKLNHRLRDYVRMKGLVKHGEQV